MLDDCLHSRKDIQKKNKKNMVSLLYCTIFCKKYGWYIFEKIISTPLNSVPVYFAITNF